MTINEKHWEANGLCFLTQPEMNQKIIKNDGKNMAIVFKVFGTFKEQMSELK